MCHNCLRCGKEFIKKGNLVIHLNAKTNCPPIVSDCKRSEQLDKMVCEPKKACMFTCEHCNKTYTTKQTLQRHMKSAHAAPGDVVPTTNNKALLARVALLEKQVEQLEHVNKACNTTIEKLVNRLDLLEKVVTSGSNNNVTNAIDAAEVEEDDVETDEYMAPDEQVLIEKVQIPEIVEYDDGDEGDVCFEGEPYYYDDAYTLEKKRYDYLRGVISSSFDKDSLIAYACKNDCLDFLQGVMQHPQLSHLISICKHRKTHAPMFHYGVLGSVKTYWYDKPSSFFSTFFDVLKSILSDVNHNFTCDMTPDEILKCI